MKKLYFIIALLSVTTIAMSQVNVNNLGHLSVKSSGSNLELLLKTNPLPEIGSNLGWLHFKHPNGPSNFPNGYNVVVAYNYFVPSDRVLKEDIVPIERAMPILQRFNSYSYYYKSDSKENRQREYGVLAQEIEAILPSLVLTADDDTKLVNYGGFIPFLIEAAKEQQAEIEMLKNIISAQEFDLLALKTLRNEFKELQELVSKCCENSLQNIEAHPSSQERTVLYQNTPNPFTSNTEIVCHLPKTIKKATLHIYNLQGMELKSYPITQTGLVTLTVSGSELPAGMYLYTLVVDNEIIDTKRMVLTK